MNEIFSYSDYRQFIKDYYETNKAGNPSFSYRYLAQKAGINSAPFYKFIIEGTRNLTKSTILKTCIALKLEERAAEYFENLVYFNQSKTIKEKNHFFDRLITLQKNRQVGTIAADRYDYFSQWYHPVIRELVTMYDFKGDYGKMAKMLSPAITAAQAEHSVRLLLDLGFLKKENGRYVQTEPVISTETIEDKMASRLRSHQVTRYQLTMFRLAIDAFDRLKGVNASLSSTTFSISEDSYKLMQKRIRELRAQLQEIARADEHPDQVYQLNVNFLPMTIKERK